MQAAFRTIGVDLPRVSESQSTVGTQVSLGNLRPGGILYWVRTASPVRVHTVYPTIERPSSYGQGSILPASKGGWSGVLDQPPFAVQQSCTDRLAAWLGLRLLASLATGLLVS